MSAGGGPSDLTAASPSGAAAPSLRRRLAILILTPLLAIAALAGVWRLDAARRTAEEIFDRALLGVTLAIARDVAVSDGDALSAPTRDLMREATGGDVFYHVHGPDGVFVTGYAYPPRGPRSEGEGLTLFDATRRGEPVRAARLTERVTIEGVTGFATVTVWRPTEAREALIWRLAGRSALIMAALILTVALVVWFGVARGLKPLEDLEDAIAKRSPDDLRPIRRPAPREARGVVARLNELFGRVAASIAARDAFISDAAHQIRNPIAGLLALAEAARDAGNDEERRALVARLLDAALHAKRMTTQFLTYERAKVGVEEARLEAVDLAEIARETALREAPRVMAAGLDISFSTEIAAAPVLGSGVLLGAAIENLIDNALAHGGPANDAIAVELTDAAGSWRLSVADRGAGVAPEVAATAFERRAQGGGEGTGLGLAIVREIAVGHGGRAAFEPSHMGARASIWIPKAAGA